ncbi:hypothetical protein ACOSP7_004917 [Xanthoceras sorbifolium]
MPRRFKDLIEKNPKITVSFLAQEILRIYGLVLPKCTLYSTKNQMLYKTILEHNECYNKIYSYVHAVKQRNLGSMVKVRTVTPELSGPMRFQRFFISFKA